MFSRAITKIRTLFRLHHAIRIQVQALFLRLAIPSCFDIPVEPHSRRVVLRWSLKFRWISVEEVTKLINFIEHKVISISLSVNEEIKCGRASKKIKFSFLQCIKISVQTIKNF